MSSCSSVSGQGIGLTDPSEMAVGDSLTPECRSAYVRRALAVSIVTYRGSKPRSIVAGAPWRDSRQFDGRSSAFRKVVDLQRKPTKDALWAASVLQSTSYAVTPGLAVCRCQCPVAIGRCRRANGGRQYYCISPAATVRRGELDPDLAQTPDLGTEKAQVCREPNVVVADTSFT